MPFACLATACLSGGRVIPVDVEADIQPGLPYFSIIGLPDKQIDEARERIRAALRNSGLSFPLGKVTVNLSPSHLPKQGTGFDLAIAAAVAVAAGLLPPPRRSCWLLGELSLNGQLRPLPYLTAYLIEAVSREVDGCIIPQANQAEASEVGECPSCPLPSFVALATALQKGLRFSRRQESLPPPRQDPAEGYLIDQVYGQHLAKRVLEISLTGRHHLLMSGPPGSGKSMLARAAAQLQPPLERRQALEVAQLYSLARQKQPPLPSWPPFRAPLPSVSRSSLCGGGQPVRPGEISLAHRGILFLDEFAELERPVREALRGPLQDGQVTVLRHGQEYIYPADCLVIAAQNGCPCGLLGAEGEQCRCRASELARYQAVLSEPLLDRFDLFCQVPKLCLEEYRSQHSVEQGAEMAKRIEANQKALAAWPKTSPADLDQPAAACLRSASEQLYLSGRSIYKIVNVARTIACVEGVGRIGLAQVREALQYRYRPPTVA